MPLSRTVWEVIGRILEMFWRKPGKWRLASVATAVQEAGASGKIDMIFETAAMTERIFSFKLKNFNAEHQNSTQIEETKFLVGIVQELLKDNRV